MERKVCTKKDCTFCEKCIYDVGNVEDMEDNKEKKKLRLCMNIVTIALILLRVR